MSGLGGIITGIVQGVVAPVTGVLNKKTEAKMAKASAVAKMDFAKQANASQVTFNEQEIEQIRTSGLDNTWKDEYVTVSVVSIFNLIIIGGVLSAFGHPQVLSGVGLALQALHGAGVDVGTIMKYTIFAAIGLSVWRKF
jgi:hypothetical protein